MLASSSSGSRTKPAAVLVIDPEPASQRKLRERLMDIGYSARAVDDFRAAQEIINSTPPDLVLVHGDPERGDAWHSVQAELNRWGIPLLVLDESENTNKLITNPLPGVRNARANNDLKLRIDTALQSRTMQDALMTENARLSAERLHDPLTGLYNRRYIMIRVEEEILRSSRRGHPLSCMLLDIDGFTKVNDDWSHNTGDAVLRDLAHIITRTLRASDIVCRYRDDEFLVLLTDTDSSGAQIASNRLRDVVTDHNFTNPLSEEPLKITVSVGISYWQPASKPGPSGTWEPQLLGLAERALKAAKQSGPNRLVILQAN